MSRNEKTTLVVTYKDVKRILGEAFDELSAMSAAAAAAQTQPMLDQGGYYPQ